MERKVYHNRSTSRASMGWALVFVAAFALVAACNATDRNPCRPAGCTVPTGDPVPAYVPLCEPTDQGPCAEVFAGAWYYRHGGARTRLVPCPTEQGAPGNTPCVWVPSVMGSSTGDSGAYVWGVPGAVGFPVPSEVEPN